MGGDGWNIEKIAFKVKTDLKKWPKTQIFDQFYIVKKMKKKPKLLKTPYFDFFV